MVCIAKNTNAQLHRFPHWVQVVFMNLKYCILSTWNIVSFSSSNWCLMCTLWNCVSDSFLVPKSSISRLLNAVRAAELIKKTRTEVPPFLIFTSRENPISFCQHTPQRITLFVHQRLTRTTIKYNYMYLVTLILILHSYLFVFVIMKYGKISKENLESCLWWLTSVLCTTLHCPNSPDLRIVRKGSLRPHPHLISKILIKYANSLEMRQITDLIFVHFGTIPHYLVL